jgi:DNA repair protein RecO (recombination protein O)
MQPERAEAIALRVQPVTESSLIVTWFTREAGKIKTMAKGARRPKNPMRGKIDLFYRDEIIFQRSRRSDLHLLHDCFLEDAHARLRDSVATLTAASYVSELVDGATEVEDANPVIFDLLAETLTQLEQQVSAVLLLWFEARLLAAAGWKLRWQTDTATGKVLRSVSGASAAAAQRVKLTDEQLDEARRTLWGFWDAEIARPPRTRKLIANLDPDRARSAISSRTQ